MTNEEIVNALWNREEDGLAAAMEQCGPYCRRIARNILLPTDAEEVVSDTWMRLWSTIPPNRPASLVAYACRITRNLAVNRYHHNKAACRRPDMLTDWAELTENPDLFETVSAADPTAESAEAKELAGAIDTFLRDLKKEDRILFIRRYVYLEDGDTLANRSGINRRHVHVKLHRIREKLKNYLREGNYI